MCVIYNEDGQLKVVISTQRLRAYRKMAYKSQDEFAGICGIEPEEYRRFEGEMPTCTVPIDMAEAIIHQLGLPTDELSPGFHPIKLEMNIQADSLSNLKDKLVQFKKSSSSLEAKRRREELLDAFNNVKDSICDGIRRGASIANDIVHTPATQTDIPLECLGLVIGDELTWNDYYDILEIVACYH